MWSEHFLAQRKVNNSTGILFFGISQQIDQEINFQSRILAFFCLLIKSTDDIVQLLASCQNIE